MDNIEYIYFNNDSYDWSIELETIIKFFDNRSESIRNIIPYKTDYHIIIDTSEGTIAMTNIIGTIRKSYLTGDKSEVISFLRNLLAENSA